MFREKLVTIIIGLVVGALLAGLFFFGPSLVSQTKKETKVVNPAPKAKVTVDIKSSKLTLIIQSPEDNSSTTSAEIKITGSTNPKTDLVIFANADQKNITSSASGKFETTIKLEEGENEISVTDLQNPMQTVTRNVTLEITE